VERVTSRTTWTNDCLVVVPVEGRVAEKTYLVAHPTEEEAISALRRVYPFETGAKIIAVAMAADQMKRLEMLPGEVTRWN
jgi:hypothetical protein